MGATFQRTMQFGPDRAAALRGTNSWTLMPITMSQENQQILFQLFCALDTDQSGGLDERDFVRVSTALQPMFPSLATRTNKTLATVFEELQLFAADTNGDGTVDFDEFSVAFMKRALKERYSMTSPPGTSLASYIGGLENELNKRLHAMITHICAKIPERANEYGGGALPMSDAECPYFGWIRVSPLTYETLFECFCMLDTDGSGGLDSGDMNSIAPVFNNSRRNTVIKQVLQELERLAADTNGDGSVDFDEFLHGIAKKGLETIVQSEPSTMSFGEYFLGLENELNTHMRAIIAKITAALSYE